MPVIAIDGPVGAGKSTVARALAARLGLDHLDTGAMYRAVTLSALREAVPIEAAAGAVERLAELARTVVVDPSEPELRTVDVGRRVSTVAALPAVRAVLVQRQREWVHERGGGVIDGRDIGSVVFPDADVKVFLTATDAERARRRADETLADLARRDLADSTRAASPLTVAPGAVVIDTTGRTIDDIVEEIAALL